VSGTTGSTPGAHACSVKAANPRKNRMENKNRVDRIIHLLTGKTSITLCSRIVSTGTAMLFRLEIKCRLTNKCKLGMWSYVFYEVFYWRDRLQREPYAKTIHSCKSQ
jgi:hypothetical protein